MTRAETFPMVAMREAEDWVGRTEERWGCLTPELAGMLNAAVSHPVSLRRDVLAMEDAGARATAIFTDFGIVKDLDPSRSPELSTTLVGTWAYTSPEHISGKPVEVKTEVERRFDDNVYLWGSDGPPEGWGGEEAGAYVDMHEVAGRVERVDQNHVKYFVDLNSWSRKHGVDVFYFSSFDESWKVRHEGDVGQRWGIWDKAEKIKYAAESP